jgi:hypothetical protein
MRKPLHCHFCRSRERLNGPWLLVPHKVWTHYIAPKDREKLICFFCWKAITTKRDGRAFEARHGRPVALNFLRRKGDPFCLPMEWDTGELMPPERWPLRWPRHYPPRHSSSKFWYGPRRALSRSQVEPPK